MVLYAFNLSVLFSSVMVIVQMVDKVYTKDTKFAFFQRKSSSDIPSSDILGTSLPNLSKPECAEHCLQDDDCVYFAQRIHNKSCVLITTLIGSSFDPTDGIQIFYGKQGSPIVDPCLTHSCINGGSCVPENTAYTCICTSGFTGEICQTDIDDCSPNPCLNGGRCIDGVAAFTCSCPAGFLGNTCSCQEFTERAGYMLKEYSKADTETGISSAEDCKALCSVDPSCIAVDFLVTNSMCFLYTNSVSNVDNLLSLSKCRNFKKETC